MGKVADHEEEDGRHVYSFISASSTPAVALAHTRRTVGDNQRYS